MRQVIKICALSGAILLASVTVAAASSSGAQYVESYSGASTISVSNILTANAYADGGAGLTQAGQSITPPEFAFSDPFLKDSKLFSANTFFFGESTDTIITSADAPPVPEGTIHLIVATNLTYSQKAIAQDFATAFPGAPSESAILSAIDTLYDDNSSDGDKQTASGLLFNFIDAASSDGALFKANGGAYNLVSFSDGVAVGSGTATISGPGGPVAVPEPSAWALMLVGFGGLGLALRRRGAAARALA